jgi:hypothetical protein
VKAERAVDALDILAAVPYNPENFKRRGLLTFDDRQKLQRTLVLEKGRSEALTALGRLDEAQKKRWRCFELSLSEEFLRDYLKRLPDFDDIEAEERALDYVEAFPDKSAALSFLTSWPALERLAKLILDDVPRVDGSRDDLLDPIAEALCESYPLAANVVMRAMITATLQDSESKRYRHCADYLSSLSGLSTRIKDYGRFEKHDSYMKLLKTQYGHIRAFWDKCTAL